MECTHAAWTEVFDLMLCVLPISVCILPLKAVILACSLLSSRVRCPSYGRSRGMEMVPTGRYPGVSGMYSSACPLFMHT
jgi:hypothetical protein